MTAQPPRGILETALYVDDLVVAEEFYARVLNLQPFSREEDRHTFYKCGNGVLLLFVAQATATQTVTVAGQKIPRHGALGPGHMAFRIHDGDVAAWRSHLNDCGVPVESEIEWPTGGHSLYFRDPAGNSLELATPRLWGFSETESSSLAK